MFFTSDQHFFHQNIIGHMQRPFENLEHMHEVLINAINETVGKRGQLYILGDLVFCRTNRKKSIENVKEILNRIHTPNITLIAGNHDQILTKPPFNAPCLKEVGHDLRTITLCHYPMFSWNKKMYGSWHLYGHMHGTGEDRFDQFDPERRCMDVGVDNIYHLKGEYRPIELGEVRSLFLTKES